MGLGSGGEGGTLPCSTLLYFSSYRGDFVCDQGPVSVRKTDFIRLTAHWIPMALDCFINVSLDESY